MIANPLLSRVNQHSASSIERWNGVLQQMFGASVSCPRGDVRFHASLRMFSALDGLLIAEVHSPGALVRHDHPTGPSANREYVVHVQTRGTSMTTQGRRQVVLEEGGFTVIDASRPYRVEFDNDTSILVLRFPQARLLSQLPWVRDMTVRPIDANRAATDLFLSLIHTFWSRAFCGDFDHVDQEMTDALIALFTLASKRPELSSDAVQHLSDVHWREMERFIEANLHRPDLSGYLIAGRLGRSLRYVQALFAARGETVTSYLRARRLELAAQCLKSPVHAHRTVIEICYDCGFQDLSHFTRLFRVRHGVPPASYRVAHLQ